MKKTLKTVLSASGLALMLALTSCVKITKSLEEKINQAAVTEKTGDDYTYAQLTKKLGNGTGAVTSIGGVVVWTEKKGNTTYTLTVTFNGDQRATLAAYAEKTEEEKSK